MNNGDLISREALKKDMCKICNEEYSDEPCEPSDCVFLNAIKNANAVDAVPVDTVAKMFCDFTGDSCACDFNGNDEWLPEVCELKDECPYPQDRLGCWKQYIKHFVERKE